MSERVLLRVFVDSDNNVHVEHATDETIARYATDKARAVVDRFFTEQEVKAALDKAVHGVQTARPGDVDRLRKAR